MNPALIGVLALQGGVIEHRRMLESLGADTVAVRGPKDLQHPLDGLVIPGGESTALSRLIDIVGLRTPLRALIDAGLPVLGTCAGLVLLADRVEKPAAGLVPLGGLAVTVRRNAFGPQLDSMRAIVSWTANPDQQVEQVEAAFIRAPEVVRYADDVEVVSRVSRLRDGSAEADNRVIGVRQGPILAVAFHPELTGDTTVHRSFLAEVSARVSARA
ncbi:MAG: pyridoxal 5'-phosphate synthase glutaminase subunit PdxT [Micrococcaceae bacterium]